MMPMSFREVLRLTVMRRIWYAQIVSLLGDVLALFAVISVATFRMHATPSQVSGVQIAYRAETALTFQVVDGATGAVRNVLSERTETFFESGQGRVTTGDRRKRRWVPKLLPVTSASGDAGRWRDR